MRLILTLFICLFSAASYGEVIVIGKEQPYVSLGKSVTWLKDGQANLSLKNVLAADQQNHFAPSKVNVLSFGNSQAAWWVKVAFSNTLREDAYLIVDIANIEEIDFYSQNKAGAFKRIHTGSVAAANSEVIANSRYIFNLPRSAYDGEIQTIYLRLKSNNVLLVPLKITGSSELIAGVDDIDQFEAISIGVLIALFLFYVSVYFKSRDLTYFYYSIRILALFIYMVVYFRGYSYLFGEDFRYFINTRPHIFLGLGYLAGIAFSFRFLDLRHTIPWAVKVIYGIAVCWTVVVLVSAFGYKSLSSDISQVLGAFSTLTLWGLGVIAWYKRYRLAMYYVVAWSYISLAAIWLSLCLSGVIAFEESMLHMIPVGMVFELLLLSLALGDRLRDMRRARVESQLDQLKMHEENLYLIGSQNERLEKIVESRTKALKKMIQSLEKANADKTRIFSIIAHDLRSPFNSLISLFSLNDMDLLTFDDVKMLLNDSRKNVDNIHNTLNNLLYWAQSQMKGLTTAPSRFNMRVMVEDLMLVYQPLISKKNISTEVTVDDDDDVYADMNQINLVMRNLLDNAIKFTPLGFFIQIRIWGNRDYIFVDVCNPVSGSVNVDNIIHKDRNEPSYGTSNERGVGLGLHLCRDFVEKNNGLLKVSKENECIVLRFNLPKFAEASSSVPEAELMEEV